MACENTPVSYTHLEHGQHHKAQRAGEFAHGVGSHAVDGGCGKEEGYRHPQGLGAVSYTHLDVYKRQSLVTSLVLLVVAIVLELAVLSVIRARKMCIRDRIVAAMVEKL